MGYLAPLLVSLRSSLETHRRTTQMTFPVANLNLRAHRARPWSRPDRGDCRLKSPECRRPPVASSTRMTSSIPLLGSREGMTAEAPARCKPTPTAALHCGPALEHNRLALA